MKTDAQLKKDVLAELEWEPGVNATNVGVAVKEGVVTLTGHLDTYAEKHAIERVLQRVNGVQAIALELDVKLAPDHHRSDAEIAQAAQSALRWHALVPELKVRLTVEKGWITLSGEVEWDFQRDGAYSAVRSLTGVVGVSNAITIKPKASPSNVATRIRDALQRQAEREAKGIEITVAGSTVTLIGTVHSWAERAAVQGAAWSAPGVSSVVNHLRIAG
jgi:osmotically-inducible protein OsmY